MAVMGARYVYNITHLNWTSYRLSVNLSKMILKPDRTLLTMHSIYVYISCLLNTYRDTLLYSSLILGEGSIQPNI
jgi:hypothetical protein